MNLRRIFVNCLAILVVMIPNLPASAQEEKPPSAPYLVKNFNTCSLGSNPTGFFNANYSYPVIWFNNIIFGKSDEATGNEVWIYDKATGQKRILADIYPGPFPLSTQSSKENYPLGLADGKLWISADDGIHGQELWAYDFLPIETYLPSITR